MKIIYNKKLIKSKLALGIGDWGLGIGDWGFGGGGWGVGAKPPTPNPNPPPPPPHPPKKQITINKFFFY